MLNSKNLKMNENENFVELIPGVDAINISGLLV